MKYIHIKGPGNPDVLQIAEGDTPDPGKGEVLIKVAAAGVNRPDIFQRQGFYPPPPGASPILGLEVSGEIISLGNGCSRWKVGDSVCALANGGGYAQFVNIPEGQCLPVPKGLSMTEAAALPETCFTVWSNVFDRAGLKPGGSFLVHGGSSGIGTIAIQMAHAFKSTVFATAGSDEKCQACRDLGADVVINYRTQDFVEIIQEKTSKRGVDVILDMVGGDYISRNITVAATDGRIVNIAFLKGSTAEVNFMPVMIKRLTITGSALRPQPTEVKAAIAQSLLKQVWPHMESGEIKPQIYRTFPLSEAAEAHRLMESGTHIGKIVLTVE